VGAVKTRVSDCDVSGLSAAYEQGADAVMLADDLRFVGIHLKTRIVVDNSFVTGRVFAAALDLMAGGLGDRPALVLGCGPVGMAGAEALVKARARVALYDPDKSAALAVEKNLKKSRDRASVMVLDNLHSEFSNYSYVLEASPVGTSIADDWITDQLHVAAPGVPLGVSEKGEGILGHRLVHDKLELGVAAMAVGLVIVNP